MPKDGTETHTYDKVGRLTGTTGSSQWGALSWTYDLAGNRATSNDAGCAVTYTYPTNDNGQASLTAVPGCIPGVTLGVTWTHDLNGRTTQGDETQNGAPTNIYQEIYNSAGRFTQDKKYSYATQQWTVRGDYWYGPDGEMLKSTEGGTTEYRFPYGQQVVYSWNSASESRDYVFGDGLILSQRKVVSGTPTPYFVFQDGGGHVRLILDNTKAVVWEAMYKPYGNAVVLTPTLPNVFRFVGNEQRDATGGLEYMHARWYNPMMGQFYTRDPVEAGGVQTMRPNLYSYGLDSPKTYGDKYGENPGILGAVALAGLATFVGVWIACTAMGHANCGETAASWGAGAAAFTACAALTTVGGPIGAGIAGGGCGGAASYLTYGGLMALQGKEADLSWEGLAAATLGGAATGGMLAGAGSGASKLVGRFAPDLAKALAESSLGRVLAGAGRGPGAKLPKVGTWENPATLTRHFGEHGGPLGITSEARYVLEAAALLRRAGNGQVLGKIDGNSIRLYDPVKDIFGSYTLNGGARTLFRPDPVFHGKSTNMDYWNAQPGVRWP